MVALYWKLLEAREDYAEAGYLTCTRMKEDLDREFNIVTANDTTRQLNAEAANAARVQAHQKALEDGVAYDHK